MTIMMNNKQDQEPTISKAEVFAEFLQKLQLLKDNFQEENYSLFIKTVEEAYLTVYKNIQNPVFNTFEFDLTRFVNETIREKELYYKAKKQIKKVVYEHIARFITFGNKDITRFLSERPYYINLIQDMKNIETSSRFIRELEEISDYLQNIFQDCGEKNLKSVLSLMSLRHILMDS